ncbi:hypothetical protein ARALYDRAFT_894360 [Arabidopsis lyrata subsp. lyrata]|uniref:BURP domain-containing protein n=1 Tax=Arabidopsis lyrata subsp. lyrata TaxID=81972 RepID=D7KUC0_ARALL|nr:hypothetical protein ARALYDRAFT_894360 [Arabidopsis lyrata subsp. lyrata]
MAIRLPLICLLVSVTAIAGKPGGGTHVSVSGGKGHSGGVGVYAGKPGKRTDVGVGKGGVIVHTRHKGKTSKTQLHDDPKAALFFLEKDMFPGKAMNLRFNAEDGCGGVKKLSDDKSVVCHKQKYPFAVFYCHKAMMTSVYAVPLEGENGMRAKAVAVCHKNTSAWNPNHLAFKVLKVKPGTVPVCHFLPETHVVWFTY